MKKIRAFLLGMAEFRLSMTSNLGEQLMPAYDTGREFAHRITFRRYEA